MDYSLSFITYIHPCKKKNLGLNFWIDSCMIYILPQPCILITFVFLFSWGTCTNRDISISQSRDSTSGIPQYIVQIVNTCVSGCAPSDIHLHCGWFASARIINPRTFKRLSYDDCLVNGGKPLKTSQAIRFTYSNSFMYPLAFKSAKFCWTPKLVQMGHEIIEPIAPCMIEKKNPKKNHEPYHCNSLFTT